MSPRFRRTLLLLSVLSVLIVPTGRAEAQGVEELTAAVAASDVVGCSAQPENAASHIRCEGNFLNAAIAIEATRVGPPSEGGAVQKLRCDAADVGLAAFRTRQTLDEGRGFVSPGGGPHISAVGQLDTVVGGVPLGFENVICRIRVADGVFHRLGTVAYGRVTVDVHAERMDAPAGVNVWREVYCARFEASAFPDPNNPNRTIFTAEIKGRVGCTPDAALHELGRGAPDVPPFYGDDNSFHG
jgi:hypothetical protein